MFVFVFNTIFLLFSVVGNEFKAGKTYVFYGLNPKYHSVAVVGLGKKDQDYDCLERIHSGKEAVRIAAAGIYLTI